ncbi:MAG: hypothetical protein HGJ94_07775 [Desulfosarcina sp.]|nr:hypothetical protein [Desulfosarcina sp.]MBC2742668.1 hypothetical protein [Desulfosarcina sp.]MBC2765578.1 hypothetical protein [Desulfosarcina sp.]
MAETAALVPVPFYAPVRTDTGLFFNFGKTPRRPLLIEQQARTVAPEADEGMAYSWDGRFIADRLMGTLVNIYV